MLPAIAHERPDAGQLEQQEVAIEARDLNVYYGHFQALRNINLIIPRHTVVAHIGPSGCGKSTLLRCFNRMNELIPEARVEGEILVEAEDIYRRLNPPPVSGRPSRAGGANG